MKFKKFHKETKLKKRIGLGVIPSINLRLYALDSSSQKQIKFHDTSIDPDSNQEMIEDDELATWEEQAGFLEDLLDGHGRTGTRTVLRYTGANADPDECVDSLRIITKYQITFQVTQIIGNDSVIYRGVFELKNIRYCECLLGEGATVVRMENSRSDTAGPVKLSKVSNVPSADQFYPSGSTVKDEIEVKADGSQFRIKGGTNSVWIDLPPVGYTIHCCS